MPDIQKNIRGLYAKLTKIHKGKGKEGGVAWWVCGGGVGEREGMVERFYLRFLEIRMFAFLVINPYVPTCCSCSQTKF